MFVNYKNAVLDILETKYIQRAELYYKMRLIPGNHLKAWVVCLDLIIEDLLKNHIIVKDSYHHEGYNYTEHTTYYRLNNYKGLWNKFLYVQEHPNFPYHSVLLK